jgi:AsmA protein
MKRLIITILGGAVALVIGLTIAAFLYVNSIDLKGRVQAALTEALGREVVIKGNMGLTLYPIVGAVADDVTVANAPGGVAARMVTAKQIAVGVEVRPLFKKEVRVRELALIEPVIALEIDKDGKPNWIFTPAPPAAGPKPGPKVEERVTEVKLSGFKVTKGVITYADARTRELYRLSDVELTGDLAGLDAPLGLKGEATYNKEPMKVSLSMNSPRALIQGKPISLNFNLNAAPVSMRFEGSLFLGDGALKGDLEASGDSLRKLADWAGSPIGEGPGLANFSVDGIVSYAQKAQQFNNASIKLDKIEGRGDFTIETASGKPYVNGRLEITNVLDLNPYLAGAAPVASPAGAVAEPAAASAAVKGVDVKQAGWDTTPLDFTGLRAINMSLDLTTRGLLVQRMRVDDAQLNIYMWNGFLKATINRMKAYGGDGSGEVAIDARGDGIRFDHKLNLDNADARKLFVDGIGFEAIDGRATVTMNVSTQGKNQKELTEALQGSGAFRFTNGALLGVDFGGVTRTLKNVLEGKVTGPNAATPFSALSATVQIRRGVAATSDFNMDGPGLNVKGQGVIDLGKQTLDLRFTPRTVFSRDAHGKATSKGIPAPVRGHGPWTALQFTTDITGKGKSAQNRVICTVVGGRECDK